MTYLINGIRYRIHHWNSDGAGPVLVLLHGFMGSGRFFSPLVNQLLTNDTEVHLPSAIIAPDLLGHGETEHSDDPVRYGTEAQVADLHQLLGRYAEHPIVLYGYSMGGRLALQYAVRHPQTLAGVILESATCGISDTRERSQRRARDERMAEEITTDMASFLNRWRALPIFRMEQRVPVEVIALIRTLQRRQNPEAMARSMRGFGTGTMPPVCEELEAMELPVRLIVGEADEKYVAINHRMNDLLPNSELSIVANSGHRVSIEQPGRVAEIITETLSSLTS